MQSLYSIRALGRTSWNGTSGQTYRRPETMKLIPVAKVTDLEPGSCLSVAAEGIGEADVNVNAAVYALDNSGPRAGGGWGEGTLSGRDKQYAWQRGACNVRCAQ